MISPRRPQTNGMVERFNGRIAENLATHHCAGHASLRDLLKCCVHPYNHQIPQRSIGHKTPIRVRK